MKIFYKHILSFLEEKPSIEDISEKLFQLGHENKVTNEIIDIEFTPNRGDCLSAYGIARDLGVFYKFNSWLNIDNSNLEPLQIDFTNKCPEDCPFIIFLNIEIDGEIKKYQPYIENYFRNLGVKKNNFFTDMSNYLAYEIGQPTHCYDFDKINNEIEFNNVELDFEFETLLGKKIKLTNNNCIFLSNGTPINLAGIMGDKSTSCSKYTNNALIECAYFNPESIIGKALKYDLNSDASYKFERGVNPEFLNIAIRRFIKIVSDHVNISKINIYEKSYEDLIKKVLDFDVSIINKILGVNISKDLYANYIEMLGFALTNDKKIIVPSHRHDIKHQNDMAEEVARIIGYNNIKIKDFMPIDRDKLPETLTKDKAIKNLLIKNGFSEVINAPFTKHGSSTSLQIDNPLDINKSFFRTSLKDSLVDNIIYNENRQHDSIKIFEISDIYTKNNGINSEKSLCLAISGRVSNNYENFSKKLDKKYLNDLFANADIDLDSNLIEKVSRDGLKTKQKNEIYCLEIKIDDIPKLPLSNNHKASVNKPFFKYNKISDFPSSTRDISFLLHDETLISELENTLLNLKSENLKEAFVFDFYKKDSNNIKIGFRFIFQSRFSTLTISDVDKEMINIIDVTKNISGVEIPGL